MRLTKKFGKYGRDYCFNCEENISYSMNGDFIVNKCLDKLGQLEDLEDELGIDLMILLKVLINGLYAKFFLENGEPNILFNSGRFNEVDKEEKCFVSYFAPHPVHLYFKDYGISWALTKEELLWKKIEYVVYREMYNHAGEYIGGEILYRGDDKEKAFAHLALSSIHDCGNRAQLHIYNCSEAEHNEFYNKAYK